MRSKKYRDGAPIPQIISIMESSNYIPLEQGLRLSGVRTFRNDQILLSFH